MALVKLGDYIKQSGEKNKGGIYTLDNLKGISIQKKFIETKADMDGVSLTPYLLIKPDFFAFVTITSRNGEKITLAHNDTQDTYICSSSYVVFYVSKPDELDSNYLFIYFNRPEFDRYARFNSWGSTREAFSWEAMCDIEIDLPDIAIQREFVAVYKAMLENQKAYEQGLGDLKLTCDAYIEKLRRDLPSEVIGKYIESVFVRNTDLVCTNPLGVCTKKMFVKSPRVIADIKAAQIVKDGQFAYNRETGHSGYEFSIALRRGENCIVSPSYQVFQVNKKDKLLPEYLSMWFQRASFDEYTHFHSWGSAQEFFTFENMQEVKIPIPDIDIQQDIVNIYNAYILRKEINERLKKQIKDICPILIKGAIEKNKRRIA